MLSCQKSKPNKTEYNMYVKNAVAINLIFFFFFVKRTMGKELTLKIAEQIHVSKSKKIKAINSREGCAGTQWLCGVLSFHG